MNLNPESYISVASILSGFGVAVFMFRIQRELHAREQYPDWPNWLAWADYLILFTIALSLLFVVFPLVAIDNAGKEIQSIAAASCAASVILLAGYPFAILDHYRIELCSKRTGDREKGEPIEKAVVIVSFIFAAIVSVSIIVSRWQ